MKIKSITTSIGAALLIDISHLPRHGQTIPSGWGVVLFGRCSRVEFGLIACNLIGAEWIADYCPNKKAAIVIWSFAPTIVPLQSTVTFDSWEAEDAVCPSCGGTQYVSKSPNWLCKGCGRQWKKNPSDSHGGSRQGSGRKLNRDSPKKVENA